METLLILRDRALPQLGQMAKWQKGPDTGIARVEATPCHRAQKQGYDFRRRPQLTNADIGADGTSQKARHQDRAEDGGSRDGALPLLVLTVSTLLFDLIRIKARPDPY